MHLVVNLPTYNEKENLEVLFPRLFSIGNDLGVKFSVVVVDDNSPDSTSDYVEEMMKEYDNLYLVKRKGKLGLGSAYIAGFSYGINELGADYVVSMDSDLSHPPELLREFVKYAPSHDIVIGCRYMKGGEFRNWPWIRKAMSKGANVYGQVWLGLKVRDISSGYRCYSADLWRKIGFENVKTNGYCTLEEILYLAKKEKATIKEVPLVFVDRTIGETKLTRKEMFNFLYTIFKLRF
ncbi:MAG: polyprenol monophosphomannose synthase [Nanoarchaeota archaeon]|nr:polyprenol monophosphomannose synthase [Nanoarchaeota archaeon]